MTRRTMTGWFDKHLVQVAVGLLVLCTLAAWADLRANQASLGNKVEQEYATKAYVDEKVKAVNDGIAKELKTIGDKLTDMRTSVTSSNGLVASRLQDIGDRLAKIEGRLEWGVPGAGVRP